MKIVSSEFNTHDNLLYVGNEKFLSMKYHHFLKYECGIYFDTYIRYDICLSEKNIPCIKNILKTNTILVVSDNIVKDLNITLLPPNTSVFISPKRMVPCDTYIVFDSRQELIKWKLSND